MGKYKIIPSSRTIVHSPISIGHKAEKGVKAIEFDLTAWVETYGSGTATIIMRRWGDEIPYPVALELDENNKATWTLSDIDTAKAGMAYAQLNYIVGDEVVKKSDIYTFRVMDSLTGEGEPPEAYDSWLEHLTHLAAEAMAEVLDIEGIVTDKTLTVDGGIADAKAAGDALALKADKSTTYTKTEVDQMIEDVEVETDTTLTIEGAAADAAETGRQIDLLKADLGAVSETTRNLVDIESLATTNITVSNGVLSGIASKLSGLNFGIVTKADTQYTISGQVRTDGNASTSGIGLIIKVYYTDETSSNIKTFSNSQTEFTGFSVTTANGKTVNKIGLSYSASGNNVWYIKELQIEEGASKTAYIEHVSAIDHTARETSQQIGLIEADLDKQASKLDALEDLAITGNSKFVKNGNKFAGYVGSSNGVLYVSSSTQYKSKVYSLSEGTTYEISTIGNRLLYGIYDSLDNLTTPVVWANKTSEIANSHIITNFKGQYLVVYYGYADGETLDASADCNVNVIATNERRKRHFNILVFGNSYAADAWGYVPFILYKYGITVNIYLYYRGSGSPSRLVQEWEDNSDNGLDIYGNEHIRRMTHIDTRVHRRWYSAVRGYSAKDILMFVDDSTKNIDKWDIITLQPVSSEQYNVNGEWTMAPGLEPAFRQVIDLINASYDKEYTLAFFETYNRIASIGGVPVSVLDDRVATMRANEAVYRAEPFGLLLPVGAAVFSARTNALLASTDISDVGNLWATDKTHLQEGLPCYIGALTICQALFNKYFKAENYSVLGESTRITSELITSWNVQFQNGAPKTDVSELAYRLGQKCAVVANNSPFDITPIYSPSDTAEIVYERSKYWADSLIDTSNIT